MSAGGPNPVQLVFGVRPFAPEASGPAALLRALETGLPGAELAYTAELVGAREPAVQLERLADREAWLRARLAQPQSAHLFSGETQPPVNVRFEPRWLDARDGSHSARVTVWLPEDLVTWNPRRLWSLFRASGDALGALHGSFMPFASAGAVFAALFAAPPAGAEATSGGLEGLPRLSPRLDLLASVLVPPTLGWLNYWSAATTRLLAPDEETRAAAGEQTPAGAWAWKLTADPFDARRPDHAAALVAAYRRFAGVGVRTP